MLYSSSTPGYYSYQAQKGEGLQHFFRHQTTLAWAINWSWKMVWLIVLFTVELLWLKPSRKLTRFVHHWVETVIFSMDAFLHRCTARFCLSPGSVKGQVCPRVAFVFSLCLILLVSFFCDSSGPSSSLFELERDLFSDILMQLPWTNGSQFIFLYASFCLQWRSCAWIADALMSSCHQWCSQAAIQDKAATYKASKWLSRTTHS